MLIPKITKSTPDTYTFEELEQPIGTVGAQPVPWAIKGESGSIIWQVTATPECAAWLDERLNTLAILQGAHSRGGSSTSEAKQEAARENGKLGGRPRQLAHYQFWVNSESRTSPLGAELLSGAAIKVMAGVPETEQLFEQVDREPDIRRGNQELMEVNGRVFYTVPPASFGQSG